MKAVRSKHGISSVIGELLVLAIVVGLMTGVIIFYNAMVGPVEQDYKSTAQQAEVSLKERFLIEDVQFFTDLSVDKMKVTIFNFGDIPLSISTVYINDVMQPFGVPPLNPIIQSSSGSFVLTYDWGHVGICHVKVVTTRGTMIEADFSPS